jgi:GTP-binding protein EngB required for normal cell division
VTSGPASSPGPEGSAILLDSVAETAGLFGLGSLDEKIAVCRRLLARPDSVAVAVLGSFKAGKSSWINLLAGEPLLPVAAVPATALLTHVLFGPARAARVSFSDGRRQEVAVASLAEWVTEEGNPHNHKGVSAVEVAAPGLARFPGLVFIDTPGLGSVFAHNTDTGLSFLPRVEAVILATPCTAPLSAADATLLRRVAELTPRFSVLLTKADQCAPAQREEVVRFVKRQLREAGVNATIHLWSQQAEFGPEREAFLREVITPLAARRTAAVAEIAAHKARQLAREVCSLLAVGGAAARRTREERDLLRKRLAALCEGGASVPAMLGRLEHEAKAGSMERMLAVIGPAAAPLREELWRMLAPALVAWGGTLGSAGHRYEAWLHEEMSRRVAGLGRARHDEMLSPLTDFAAGCEQLVGLFHTQLAEAVRETLGVGLELPAWQAEFTPPTRPDVSISPAFDLRFDWLYAVTPAAWVRPWLRRHLGRRVAWESEKNLSRLASQWSRALGTGMTTLAGAAHIHVEAQRGMLSAMLALEGSDPAAWEQARVRLAAAADP